MNRNTKLKGDIALTQAIAWFIKEKYEVLLPIGDKRDYDFVVEKDNTLKKVQVKFAGIYKNGKCKAGLRITGGNQSFKTIRKYSDNAFDFLFIYSEKDTKFCIPWSELLFRNELTIDDKKYIKYQVS